VTAAEESDKAGDTEDELAAPPTPGLTEHLLPDTSGKPLKVPLNYEIITLFSEGLYQSPHKAVEELVSNSYDAGAKNVRIILPRDEEEQDSSKADSLFVIDDGTGMDSAGFETLWKIAESPKAKITGKVNGRLPIGQFGIGKLAAYVLAWRLTHISKRGSTISYTTMDFHRVQTHHLNSPDEVFELRLHQISVAKAKDLLAEVKTRDPDGWKLLFGPTPTTNWTVAVLSDFKGLYDKLSAGTLSWVLRSGLPITSEFALYLDTSRLESPAEKKVPLYKSPVGGQEDVKGRELAETFPDEISVRAKGIEIEGIPGLISGEARLYETPLDRSKIGTQYHRSNGFFIRVRGRIINLEDELFGLEAQNHSAWSRFVLTVDADGLREHLLSSREGVKGSRAMTLFRRYLHEKFNECRSEFESDARKKLKSLDIERLLMDAPSTLVVEPLVDAVTRQLGEGGDSYYLGVPDIDADDRESWLESFSEKASKQPIENIRFDQSGPYDRLARWHADTRELVVNKEHPFMAKLETHSKGDTALDMISTIEVVTDALLRESGLRGAALLDFFERRDRVLRVIAGQVEANSADVLRELAVSNEDEVALERSVGRAFELLGMDYQPGGTNLPGDDGYLVSRLGVVKGQSANFTVVYDAKSTTSTTVDADKCDLGSLETFRGEKKADYAFFVGKAFASQADPKGKLNRKLEKHEAPATLLTLGAIERLVSLQVRYGVPQADLRGLFEQRTTGQVDAWLNELEERLSAKEVPLLVLLEELEKQKADEYETPNVKAVRMVNDSLKLFGADRLIAVLRGLQAVIGSSWIEVDEQTADVVLHDRPARLLEQFDKRVAGGDTGD
jgi:hypothetical protein